MCDATEGITAQDLRVAELAMKSGCATALVLNKWDLADDFDLDHERARAHQKLRLRPAGADGQREDGRHVERLLVEAVALADRARARIPTPQLNRFLADAVAARQPPLDPADVAADRLKLLFMTQTAARPPRFSIQVNTRARVTRDYAYYLENRLRERYGWRGSRVIIDFVERSERRQLAQVRIAGWLTAAPVATLTDRPTPSKAFQPGLRVDGAGARAGPTTPAVPGPGGVGRARRGARGGRPEPAPRGRSRPRPVRPSSSPPTRCSTCTCRPTVAGPAVEQALALARRLPDWRCCRAPRR